LSKPPDKPLAQSGNEERRRNPSFRAWDEFSIALPDADFLLSNSYDELMIGVRDLKHIGRGVIDGVECEHLVLRTENADGQLWVEVGATPMSYAGVARRTTRRAIAAGAAVAAPVLVAPTPACVQAVDVYGRIYTRCR
jgi:hypothetical protein